MVDKEKIFIIIEDINFYTQKLNDLLIKSLNDLKKDINFYASSMLIFSILNRTIDLGDEVVKSEKLGYPLEIKEIFTLLSGKGIINKSLEFKMKDLVVARNKLSHRYGKISKEDIFSLINDLKFVKKFVDQVSRYINEK